MAYEKRDDPAGTPGGFTMIPNWLVDDETLELTGPEVLAFVALSRFADRSGRCWPSMRTLARRMRTCERTARKAVRRLEVVGLIATIRRQYGLVYEILRNLDGSDRRQTAKAEQSDDRQTGNSYRSESSRPATDTALNRPDRQHFPPDRQQVPADRQQMPPNNTQGTTPKEQERETRESVALESTGVVTVRADKLEKLDTEFGRPIVLHYAEKVADYCQTHGKSYKDYAAAIRQYIRRNKERGEFERIASNVRAQAKRAPAERCEHCGRPLTAGEPCLCRREVDDDQTFDAKAAYRAAIANAHKEKGVQHVAQ